MNFSENLHFIMESRDIQVKELSARTGISINTLKSYLKTDAVEPKVSNAVLVAKALHVNVETLVETADGGDAPPPLEIHEINRLLRDCPPRDLKLILALVKAVLANSSGRDKRQE